MRATSTIRCGCPEQVARSGFTRRQLMARAGLVGAAAAAAPMLQTHYAWAADPAYTGDTLVVLSFRGGMDGLSVVVPHGDPDYAKLRPTIGLVSSQLLSGTVDSMFGLHPSLAPLQSFWTDGTFGVVNACGLPAPDRSHFAATEEMERATFDSPLRTGWLDRVLGVRGVTSSSFQLMEVGDNLPPDSMLGPHPELAMSGLDSFRLAGSDGDGARWATALRAMHSGAVPSLLQPVTTTLKAINTVAGLGLVKDYVPSNGATYDSDSSLANALRDVARLIKAKVGLQIACIDYGDWDMHVGLGLASQIGDGSKLSWMRDHLSELAQGLAAFATDLGPTKMNDVTLVTLTEFGRRAQENGDHGVDHGYGTAVMLMGGGVVGGQVHLSGPWPTLADGALVDGDLNATTDYRSVLAEILSKRCRVSSAGLKSIFPGGAPGVGSWVGAVSPKVG
jgi:uncharacterized protein (DUF1501 family)